MSEANKGKTLSNETKRKISEAAQNMSDETRRKLSEAKKGENHPMYGKTHTEETRRKMSEANKGPKKKITCPNCMKTGGANAMKRYHFDNCKKK